MKFTYKIMLSPLATALAFLVIFAVTQRAAEHSSRTIGRIQDEFFHATELSHDLQIELLSLRHLMTEAATTGNRDALQDSENLAAQFRATVDGCQGMPALAAMIEPLTAKFDRYYARARSTTEEMIRQGGGQGVAFDQHLITLVEQMNQSYADLSGDIGVVVARNNDQLELAIGDMRERLVWLRRVMNITSVIFLALLVVLSILVIGSIVRPVHRMNRVAQAISGGDLGQELDYYSRDAIGELADSIREMQASLIRDIARREKAESELIAAQGQTIQAEKMAVLGKLVAGLTHELNSPLGTMTSSVDVLGRSHAIIKQECAAEVELEEQPERVHLIRAFRAMEQGVVSLSQATARIEELVNGLKVFSQLDKGEVQQTDINEGLRATLVLIGHDIPAGVEIVQEFGKLEPVLGYPAQLNQAFIVLIRHAIRDTPPPGSVTITTEQLEQRVRVTITDTGCGYRPEALSALFNPSFRAATGRMHMDWEMVSSRRIIDRHQGTITAKSDPGQGTRYVVEIPVWPDLSAGAV